MRYGTGFSRRFATNSSMISQKQSRELQAVAKIQANPVKDSVANLLLMLVTDEHMELPGGRRVTGSEADLLYQVRCLIKELV